MPDMMQAAECMVWFQYWVIWLRRSSGYRCTYIMARDTVQGKYSKGVDQTDNKGSTHSVPHNNVRQSASELSMLSRTKENETRQRCLDGLPSNNIVESSTLRQRPHVV
jgi:hypothetical protein